MESKKTETLEEFLARGGKINKLPAAPASAPEVKEDDMKLPPDIYDLGIYKTIELDQNELD